MNHLLNGIVLAAACAAIGCDDTLAVSPPLVTGQRNVTSLQTDGTHVYWSTADGFVRRVPAGGGAVQEVAHGVVAPTRIALDDDSVYWAASGGEISRSSKTGGAAELLVQNEDGLGDLQVGGGRIFWLRLHGQGQISGEVRVTSTLSGGPVESLVSDAIDPEALSLALAGPVLYYPALASSVLGDAAGVRQLPSGGGMPAQTFDGTLGRVAAHGASVCAAGIDPQALASDPGTSLQAVTCAALDGSGVRVVASGLASPIGALAMDDTTVYFAGADGSLSAVYLDGSAPVVPSSGLVTSSDATAVPPTYPPNGPLLFAQGPPGATSVVSDGTTVYWAHASGDAVFSMPAF